tara:strand:- start:168433 stop:169251 length:819 start_codon:yes stop_codon:yes gene_type:complete
LKKEAIGGVGMALQFPHIDYILKERPKVPWFEIDIDRFVDDGIHHAQLKKLRAHYPIVFHCRSLNLGGVDKFPGQQIIMYKSLIDLYEPEWFSDHLCWTSFNGHFHHDLLPVPRTTEGLINLTQRIDFLQEFFDRSLVIQNISSYIEFDGADFSEVEFIKEVQRRSGCKLLLDISSVLIDSKNKNRDPNDFFAEYPIEKAVYGRLSGGAFVKDLIMDSRSNSVNEMDIQMYQSIWDSGVKLPVALTRSADIPPFKDLEDERQKIEGCISGLQ